MTQVASEFDARIEMKAFIDRARAPYSQWYVGITADPDERLAEHGLQEADWYIVRRLASAEADAGAAHQAREAYAAVQGFRERYGLGEAEAVGAERSEGGG